MFDFDEDDDHDLDHDDHDDHDDQEGDGHSDVDAALERLAESSSVLWFYDDGSIVARFVDDLGHPCSELVLPAEHSQPYATVIARIALQRRERMH